MSGGSKKFLQRCVLTRALPYLKQGSTLSIRSHLRTDLKIRSHWRDDGKLFFEQHSYASQNHGQNVKNSSAQILLSRDEDKMTSLGREDPHVSICVLNEDGMKDIEPNEGKTSPNEQAASLLSMPPPTAATEENEAEGNRLTLDVPDKINIDCDLTEGGSILVENKIEGDVRLKTALGSISVKKLRGHNIELEIKGEKRGEDGVAFPSNIFVSEVLESQSLRLAVPRPSMDRIRAKRIHANTMEIVVGGEGKSEDTAPRDLEESLFDDDDSGAICDISSLYLIGDGSVNVQQASSIASDHHQQRQAVRIKSHHGHLHVQASAPKPDNGNDLTGDVLPLVDLGGVNGSCEVWVSRPAEDTTNSVSNSIDDNWTSCHVHFDSIAPDSVSLLHAEEGNIHVTVDRKVESDVRLLSTPFSASIDTEILLLEDNEDDSMADEISHMLQEFEAKAASNASDVQDSIGGVGGINKIQIKTQAFTSRERPENEQLQHSEFVDGWIENTTSEPDSRFDRKIRGSGGGGKIRLDGAQNQALHGFGGTDKSGSAVEAAGEDAFARPLLAVSSPGNIVLETLSWLGNIARRYGLDDKRNDDDLGRQATRRKGLGREIPTNE